FSSRRRHTRYWRDWSSDVCSSDLRVDDGHEPVVGLRDDGPGVGVALEPVVRSEERRVGKECRSRWSPYDLKKKEELVDGELRDVGEVAELLVQRDWWLGG